MGEGGANTPVCTHREMKHRKPQYPRSGPIKMMLAKKALKIMFKSCQFSAQTSGPHFSFPLFFFLDPPKAFSAVLATTLMQQEPTTRCCLQHPDDTTLALHITTPLMGEADICRFWKCVTSLLLFQ